MIDFKTQRIKEEWENGNLSGKLKSIIIFANLYAELILGKSLLITDLFRTQAEQDQYYGKDPAYKKKPWQSVHQSWRGVDFRTTTLTPAERDELLKVLLKIPYDLKHPTAIYHDIGQGAHIHVQIPA